MWEQVPKGWRRQKLGKLFRIKHGFAFKGKYFAASGPYVLLTPGNFFDEGGFKSKGEKEKYYTGDPPDDYVLERGDLLVAMTEQAEGLLGSSALIPESGRYLHNQRLGLITDLQEQELDKRYLYYLFNFRWLRSLIRASASGVKVRHTSPSRIGEIEVALPQLDTQRKIASILSAYADLIENNLRRIQILDEMAQALYREWFVEFRFPGFHEVATVGTPLGDLPTTWRVVPFDKVAEVTDYVANGSFASLRENVQYMDQPDYAILVRTKDYNNSWRGQFVYVDEPSYRFLKKSSVRLGDIVICNVGSVGTVFRVPDLGQPMTLGPNAVLVKNHAHPGYLFHFLSSAMGQHLLASITSGSAQPKFNKTELRRLLVPDPPDEVKKLFERYAGRTAGLVENLRKRAGNLRATQDHLLPKLITGELDVSDLDIAGGEAA